MGKGSSPKIDETEEQKELASIAAEKFDYFESELKPMRDVFIGEMLDGNNEAKYDRLAGTVKADAGTFLNSHLDGAEAQMKASGIDPSSGRYAATVGNVANSAAEIESDSVNRGQSSLQDNYVLGLGNVVAMGEKKSMQAMDGLSDVAAKSADHARQSVSNKLGERSDAKTGLGLVGAVGLDTVMNSKKGG